MKKLSLLFMFWGFLFQFSFSQNYISFPTASAHWNCLIWHQWQPETYFLTTYLYLQKGDTLLKGKNYHKIYYKESDMQNPAIYIGGLREDNIKQIFFFPASINIPTLGPHTFPNDTSEQLLYSFNNMNIGDNLAINSGYTSISVSSIDTVLVGTNFRKRYKIQNTRLFANEYWIEGIGSTKDLLSPFTYEFEWQYYTLCYGDINTYYINSPDGNDSCHYSKITGIIENEQDAVKVYPNPASDFLNIETPFSGTIVNAGIYTIQGQLLKEIAFTTQKTELDIRKLNSGLYFLQIKAGNRKTMYRFIKK